MALSLTVGHRFGRRQTPSRSRGRLTRLIVACALFAGGLLASEPTPAAAEVVDPDLPCPTTDPVGPGAVVGFEIDGNCQVDVAGLLDWQSPEVGTQPVVKDGLADETNYTGGSHETNWPEWEQGTGTASGQADIADVYAFSTIDGDEAWAIFAFSRAAGTGSIGYTVELNQLPNRSDSPAIPERSVGDWRVHPSGRGGGTLAL